MTQTQIQIQTETDAQTQTQDPTQTSIHFGTDGWRAIIGEDFNDITLARVAEAAAKVFAEDYPGATIYVGYDTRLEAARYAALVAYVVSSYGFKVILSDKYCPTPALCWTIARDEAAKGGLMITSSHNPAEYLGLKLRMQDGGASPKEFTDRVEAAMSEELPKSIEDFIAESDSMTRLGFTVFSMSANNSVPYEVKDIMSAYLCDLESLVDKELIRAAGLRVLVDPMYGAGRRYLANTLRHFGVEVKEIHGEDDPSFGGLHPEPIIPWIDEGRRAVVEEGFDAGFVTDGDADRIGGIDEHGNFVNPHRILALMIENLVRGHNLKGTVVTTVSGSVLITRQCQRFGLPLAITPVGFKWIYEQMKRGNVLIGGEESGGIGMPTHVCERDGLLCALTLVEMMAANKMTLGALVEKMFAKIGAVEYKRRDLKLSDEQKSCLQDTIAHFGNQSTEADAEAKAEAECAELFSKSGKKVKEISRLDGLKFIFDDSAWLLLRLSGTEPLVRIYAEAENADAVEALLEVGTTLATIH